jgi:glycosyltransferase involved in cell wall biosynthesis
MADHDRRNLPTVLVFADDWGRHPSSCQHLVGHLLDRYQVLWINTIGTRQPRLDFATLSRGLEKVGQWAVPRGKQERARAGEGRHPNLRVLNPKMWPSFGSRLERRINRSLLLRQIAPFLTGLPQPAVAVTNIPVVADLVGHLPVRRWVYYCVDDFAEWPGLDGSTLRAMESELVTKVDTLIAVSDALQEKLERSRSPVHLLTHGVDLAHWREEVGSRGELPWLSRLERPLIVFWGVIDQRMDVTYLERLAQDLDSGTMLLVGPQSAPPRGLESIPRLVCHPSIPFQELPAVARAADVLIMPYADLPVTRAMQPLKLKEYLATGKPVVVRDLPSTRPWADSLDVVATPEEFSQAVRERLATGLPESQQSARVRLVDEAWSAKARDFERWLFDSDLKAPRTQMVENRAPGGSEQRPLSLTRYLPQGFHLQ